MIKRNLTYTFIYHSSVSGVIFGVVYDIQNISRNACQWKIPTEDEFK